VSQSITCRLPTLHSHDRAGAQETLEALHLLAPAELDHLR
jgi:hypothetical protein